MEISLDVIKNLAVGTALPLEYKFYKYKQEDFSNKMSEQETILLLIQSIRFTLIDLIYLMDVGKADPMMIKNYNELKENLHKLTNVYEQKYGLLSHFSTNSLDHKLMGVKN